MMKDSQYLPKNHVDLSHEKTKCKDRLITMLSKYQETSFYIAIFHEQWTVPFQSFRDNFKHFGQIKESSRWLLSYSI